MGRHRDLDRPARGPGRRIVAGAVLGVLAAASVYGLVSASRDDDLVQVTAASPAALPAGSGDAAVPATESATGGTAAGGASPSPEPAPVASASSLYRGVTCSSPGTAQAQAAARRLQQAIATAVDDAPQRISVAVQDWKGSVTCSFKGAVAHDSASIVKVLTLAALLRERAEDGRSLSATEKRLATSAITVSDNSAQSSLWSRIGGTSGAAAFMRAADMTHSTPASSGKWGLTQATASDELQLLREITHGDVLTDDDADYLLGLMRQVDPAQSWGISAGAPAGSTVAIKNGWLGETSGWHINSIGYVTGDDYEVTLAVLSAGSPSMDAGVDAVEKVARAVHGALGTAA
jgi:beta-lactamase class A